MALVASAAFCARLAILAVLVAAGVAGISRVEFQLIAYALAVTSAVQVIVDSSTAGAFTVINWDRYEATPQVALEPACSVFRRSRPCLCS